MNLPFDIEMMTKDDLDEVTAIENSCFNQPWTLQSFKTDLQYNRLAYYLVARHDGKIVGYIGAWIVLGEAHITTLAVDHDYRCHGVASCLIQALIDEGARRGVTSLTLEVRPSNKVARSFYKKWGFTVRGRRKRYYTDEDALIMSRTEAPRAAGAAATEIESQ